MVFTLSQEQFAAFEGHARDRWCQTAARDLFESYATYYTAFNASADTLLPMVKTTAAWAQRHDIRSQADVTRLCHVSGSLGHRFWRDPRFRGYVTASMSVDVPPGRRATAMMGETKTWLRRLWAGDSLLGFSTRLVELVRESRGPDAQALRYVLPGHWQMFSTPDNERLLGWLSETVPDGLRDDGSLQLAYTACALAHGTQWLGDPQYQRLAKIVRAQTGASSLAEDLEAVYTEALA